MNRQRRALASVIVAGGLAAGFAISSIAVGSEVGPTPDRSAHVLPGAEVLPAEVLPNVEAPAAPPSDDSDPAAAATTLPALPMPENAPADNDPEPQTYHGRLVIPAIDVDSPLLEGIRLSTLDYGPGHWPGSAMPGQLGNTVVAGHRTTHNADFRRLDELEPGDEVIFDLDDDAGIPTAEPDPDNPYSGVYTYAVTSVFIVPPEGMWIVGQSYRHEATLFACHPPGSVAERIVVQLDLVAVDGEPLPEPDPERAPPTQTTVLY